MLFHQDNAPAHMSPVSMAAIQKCGFQLVEDPPYALDLVPSYYYLFTKIQNEIRDHHFVRDDDVMNVVDPFLGTQNGAFYTEGIRLLHDGWTKCVNVGGDYVEKLLHLIFLKLTSSTLGHTLINQPSYSCTRSLTCDDVCYSRTNMGVLKVQLYPVANI